MRFICARSLCGNCANERGLALAGVGKSPQRPRRLELLHLLAPGDAPALRLRGNRRRRAAGSDCFDRGLPEVVEAKRLNHAVQPRPPPGQRAAARGVSLDVSTRAESGSPPAACSIRALEAVPTARGSWRLGWRRGGAWCGRRGGSGFRPRSCLSSLTRVAGGCGGLRPG